MQTADNLKYSNHIAHYRKDAEFHDYFSDNPFDIQSNRRRYEQIFQLIKRNHPRRILEIGSGGGYALKMIKALQVQYFPLDIALVNLKKLRQRSSAPVSPVSGDIYRLPFKEGAFDTIILSEVLEHLDTPQEALKEVYRVLTTGSRVVISVPYKEKITYQICVHCNQPTPTHAHFHSFDAQKLCQWTESCGFETIKIITFANKLATRLSVYRLLKWAPFPIWKFTDGLFNRIFARPSHLICLVKK